MNSLLRWQIISLISRIGAMAIGLVQTAIILRILTVGEWGLIQLAVSIGAMFGIYQHLGLASGSTREISAREKDQDIWSIFISSTAIRYTITIPLALILYLSAEKWGTYYQQPEIIILIKIYALILIVQGIQSMLNSVISGTKRFKTLFIYQVVIAFVQTLLYIPLIYLYKVTGYFYGMLAFNILATLTLSYLAFKPLNLNLRFPSRVELLTTTKNLLSISLAIYAIKIIYTFWEKSGNLLLGKFGTVETIAIFAFAMLYGKKMVNISDAVTDVSLPVFSEKFKNNISEFRSHFSENFNKLYGFFILSSSVAVFWSPQLITLFAGSDKYNAVQPLILPMVYVFVVYSLLDIIKSSVVIPAKMIGAMVIPFIVMFISTVGFFLGFNSIFGVLSTMAYGMLSGVVLGFGITYFYIVKQLKFSFLTHDHFLIGTLGILFAWNYDVDILTKLILSVVYLAMFIWGLHISEFFTISEFKNLIYKGFKKFGLLK